MIRINDIVKIKNNPLKYHWNDEGRMDYLPGTNQKVIGLTSERICVPRLNEHDDDWIIYKNDIELLIDIHIGSIIREIDNPYKYRVIGISKEHFETIKIGTDNKISINKRRAFLINTKHGSPIWSQ